MNLIFNELSLKLNNLPLEASDGNKAMSDLVQKLEDIQKIAKQKVTLRTTVLFKDKDIAVNHRFALWAKDAKNAPRLSVFLSMVAQMPVLEEPPYYYYTYQ